MKSKYECSRRQIEAFYTEYVSSVNTCIGRKALKQVNWNNNNNNNNKVEGSAGFEPAVILSQVGQVLKRPRLYLEDQPG